MSVMNKLLRNTNWSTFTGRLHVGIDMLVTPPVLTLVDDVDFRVHERKRLPDRPEELIEMLRAAGTTIADIVVLAGRDGYALVDQLAAAGFRVDLLTPANLRRYAGIRNVHDKHEAYWMAHLLRAGALPLGEVYCRGEIRDTHPQPALYPTQMPSLASRLKVAQPQVIEFVENRESLPKRRL